MAVLLRARVREFVQGRAALVGLGALLTCWVAAVHGASAQVATSRPLGRDIAVYRPDAAGQQPRTFENPAGPISLRDALALGLMQNPELAGFAWEIRAREARALQAGRRPNPSLTGEIEDLAASGRDGLVRPQTTIQLSQIIELGGKRIARQQLADASRDLAGWDFEAARIDVLTRVARAYVDVLAGQRAVELATQSVSIVQEVQQAVAARVTAGVVSPIEQTKAEVALANARIEAGRTARGLEAGRRALAALWGAPDARFTSAAGDLTTPAPVPTFEALHAQVAQNPELARWAAEVAQRDAAVAVERAKGVPDVTVSAGYRRLSTAGANALVVSASIPLPFFDKNRDAVREASARASKAVEEQRAAQVRVTAMLAEAYRALAAARDEVDALATGVLPGARSAFDAINEGYRLGRFGYLDVLDAQRTLVAANGQHLSALSDYHKAAADVERLIGAALSPVASAAGIK